MKWPFCTTKYLHFIRFYEEAKNAFTRRQRICLLSELYLKPKNAVSLLSKLTLIDAGQDERQV